VSSDPFADLADSLSRFASAFREVLKGNQSPTPGSPAATEAGGEPFAGEWGAFPSRDILATILLAAASAADHLVAVGSVLRGRNAVFAPYTVMRAAAEAAAVAVYLTDPAIDGRERVRRNMNCRLDALCEQIRLVGVFQDDDAARMADRNRQRLGDFERAARRHGFRFRRMDGPRQSAYLDNRLPSAMELVDLAMDKNVPGLGVAYQRHLSSVAHTKLHGLTRFPHPAGWNPAGGGQDIHQRLRRQDRAGTAGRASMRREPGRRARLVHRMGHRRHRQPDGHHAGDLGPDRRRTLPVQQQGQLIPRSSYARDRPAQMQNRAGTRRHAARSTI